MYKLTVIAGPNRGQSFAIQEGENSIGRQSGNVVMLPSAKISKRHCVLVVNNTQITLKDEGSQNGTFVNGVLVKRRKVQPGDRISLGDYVLEISDPLQKKQDPAPALAELGNVVRFPVPYSAPPSAPVAPNPAASALPAMSADPAIYSPDAPAGPPKDLKSQIFWHFEKFVMPIFYGLNFKYEWRFVAIGVFAAFIVANLFISVSPLVDSTHATIVRESARRAAFMARLIAEKNAPFLAAQTETRTEIPNAISDADGVRVAVLTDLENRIIAPGTKINQYLTNGPEAVTAIYARDQFRRGLETGIRRVADEATVVAVEPVRVVSTTEGKNVTVGMAIVSIDTTIAAMDMGEVGVVYSETLILTALFGGLILLVLYRLTLKPFEVLNDEMDKALKGDLDQVSRSYKFGEMNSLWDLINSTLQRAASAAVPGAGGSADLAPADVGLKLEDILSALRLLGGLGKIGIVVCDHEKRIVHLNPVFEEISGIHEDGSIGQDLPSVARDQAFGVFTTDLLDRATPGADGVSEDFEFSGVAYRVHAMALAAPDFSIKGYILAAVRHE